MSYRDDLAAALARIDTLEQLLAATEQPKQALIQTNEDLNGRAESLEHELSRANRVIERMRERLYGEPVPPSELESLPTLQQHNRGVSPRLRGTVTQVLCPSCIGLGIRVQMILRPENSRDQLECGEPVRSVVCPHCAVTGLLR